MDRETYNYFLAVASEGDFSKVILNGDVADFSQIEEGFIGSAGQTESVAPSERGTFDKTHRTKPRVPRLWGLNGRQPLCGYLLGRNGRSRIGLSVAFFLVDVDERGFFTSAGFGVAHGGRFLDCFEEF
jgi:hypothetical protein